MPEPRSAFDDLSKRIESSRRIQDAKFLYHEHNWISPERLIRTRQDMRKSALTYWRRNALP